MSLRLPYDQTSEKAFARDIAEAEARVKLLETHLRQVLKAGEPLRGRVSNYMGQDWDLVASEAEGALASKQSPAAAEHR